LLDVIVPNSESFLRGQYKLYSGHIAHHITIHHRQILGRKMLQFGAPARIRNLYLQDASRESQGARAGRHCRTARQWPSQKGRIRRSPQTVGYNFLKCWRNSFHKAFDSSILLGASCSIWENKSGAEPKATRHSPSTSRIANLLGQL
jgi:hypothetical protein